MQKRKKKKERKTLYRLPAELCAADQRETEENKNRESLREEIISACRISAYV